MKASDLLFKAAEEIEKRGWCQNHFESEAGQICLYGAIFRAAGWTDSMQEKDGFEEPHELCQIATVVEPYIRMEVGEEIPYLADWNDLETTTATDVIDVLNHAGKRALEAEEVARV